MSSASLPTPAPLTAPRRPRTILLAGLALGVTLTLAAIVLWNALHAPLALSWRPSLLDPRGQVLQVSNTTDRYLSCVIHATNTVKNQRATHNFSLAPHERAELGTLEMGWSFKTGEQVTIHTEGFSTTRARVP